MKKLKIGIILLVSLLVLSTAAAMTMAEEKKDNIYTVDTIRGTDSNDNRYVPNEIIVKFIPGVKGSEIANINSKHKTEVLSTSQHGGFKLLKIPKGKSVPEMVEIYSKNPNVEYAEPNYIVQALMVPNDPLYSPYQWHLDNAEYGGINMEAAWDISTGSNDVIVAVLDTGVAYETYDKYVIAPDLASTCFVSGYDFVNNDDHPNDDAGHGTHVTGTIAQNTNNSLGVAGVAFDTCIMPVKVLNKRGSGTYDMIANGIYFAANNGADIISMSLSGSIASTTLENALAHAYGKGVTIIASSGNNGPEKVGYPAAYDEYVIAVGATRYDEARAPYSSYYSDFEDPVIRNYVDITAPGGDMGVDQNEDGYGDGVLQQTHNGRNYGVFGYYFYQGTSMAAPHVAGVAALIMANNIATTPDDVRYVLEFTAEDKNVSGWDPQYGYGIVDAYAALNYNPTPVDNDGDTYYSDVDCNDSNASIHPNAIEICNGVDDNCNGTIDEGFDLDNDGYTSCGGDCNDSDLTINPEAPETSCDGIDNDCDSLIDEGYISYTCGIGACEAPSVCTSGEVYCIEGSPIDEVCGDGIDNDCDGETDEDCEPIEVCGDGAVQSPNSDGFSEECDGSDLGGNTCDDLSGYDSGTLSCNQDCTYNTNSCTLCGDCFKDVCDGVCHPRKENSVSCSDCW